jgi:hypothetical protein
VFCVTYEPSFYIELIQINVSLGHSKALAAIRLPLTAKARIQFQFGPCNICGGERDIATRFSLSNAVLPRQFHPTIAPYSSWNRSYQKDKRAKPRNLPKKQFCFWHRRRKARGCKSTFTLFLTPGLMRNETRHGRTDWEQRRLTGRLQTKRGLDNG